MIVLSALIYLFGEFSFTGYCFLFANYYNFRIIYVFIRCDRPFNLWLYLFLLACLWYHGWLFSETGSLLLQKYDLLHYVNEHATLKQGLTSVILKAHNHNLHTQSLLGVADAINEVTIARKECNTVNIGTKGVVYQVNGDGHIYLCLNLPLDLFFATASTFCWLLLVLSYVQHNLSVSLFEDLLIEPCIFSVSFMIFAGHESDLIKLMPRYLLEKSKEGVKSRGGIHWKVQILQAYLKVSPIYNKYMLGTLGYHGLDQFGLRIIGSKWVRSALITCRRQTL